MTLASAQDGIRAIPLEDLQVSNTGSQAERRKHFDKAAIGELAESIKTLGLLSPIIARQVNGHLEVVAGERRLLAAKKAGLAAISVDVRTLTDEQVLEVQLVENLQREGLHELAEAEGYEALQGFGHTADEIADKVGKSKAYVYARMKLLALCQDARKDFYDGKISASVALLLARIPVENVQKLALKEVRDGRFTDGPLSYREASDLIQRQFMLRLADAAFPTDDEKLVPGALPCGRCPKNTNAQPQLFGDVKGGSAGVCTDPGCFNAKKEAHAKRQIETARAGGQKVLEGKAAKDIFPHGTYQAQAGYVRMDSDQYANGQYRKVSSIVGKSVTPTLVRAPQTGELIQVVAQKDLKDAMKAKGIKDDRGGRSANSEADRKARAKRQTEEIYRTAVLRQMFAKAPKELGRQDLEAIAEELFDSVYGDQGKRTFEILGWELPAGGDYRRFEKGLKAKLPKLTGPELNGLILVVLLQDAVGNQAFDGAHGGLEAAAKRLKIDTAKIRKDLTAAAPPAKKSVKTKTARKSK